MEDEQNSIERLNLILTSTSEGWWEWNILENTTYHSPQWYEMLGYKKDEWASTFNVWAELMHPEDRDKTIALQSEYMQTKEVWDLEFRMRCKNGEYKWILSRGRTVERNEQHQASKIVGIHLDITERKNTEALKAAYEKQEALLKGIIQVSPATFKTYDYIQNKMVYSSNLGARFLNYTPEEFKALSNDFVEKLIHPDDRIKVEEALSKLIKSKTNDMVECIFRLKKSDGDYIWAKTLDWVSKRAEDGTVQEIIGSIQDVTRYKSLDEKISQSIKVLENLSHKNSHLVRGPVSSILGLIDLIKSESAYASIDPVLIEHLERTVIKLDEVIREFNSSLNDQLEDIS